MAVMGWQLFRERFSGYEDCYTVIGGFACEVLLRNAELDFRATKDIDMIVLLEDRFSELLARLREIYLAGENGVNT